MLDFFASLCVAILAGLGVGGGGLLVIYLTFVKHVGQLEAQGVNLIFFICAAISSLFLDFKKRKINIFLALILILSGLPGVLLGFYLTQRVSPQAVRTVFGIMLIFSGITVFFKKSK